jgi:hypothetical protein
MCARKRFRLPPQAVHAEADLRAIDRENAIKLLPRLATT